MTSIIKNRIAGFAAATLLLGTAACTGNFEQIKDGYDGITEEMLTQDSRNVGASFPQIMSNVYLYSGGWGYQTYQNLNADVFSGYMAMGSFPTPGNLTYLLNNSWNDTCWSNSYTVMTNWMSNYEVCMRYGFPDKGVLTSEEAMKLDWKESVYNNYLAVNLVCKVLGMSRLADQYGPIIYSAYGVTDLAGAGYDSLQDVYAKMFTELKDAVEILDWATNNSVPDFSRFDKIYGGDMTKWARLANTLRLRLAMRIVSANPDEAKAQAEAAVAAPQGTMGKGDSYKLVPDASGWWNNPLWVCSISYTDLQISANLESILGGYGDPRLARMGQAVNGKVKGIRTGLPDTADLGTGSRKEQYLPVVSLLNLADNNEPGYLVRDAETAFLKAEGALRGWNMGGDAESFYAQGVEWSFAEWGVSGADAYVKSSAVPADYEDPLYSQFNISAVSTVSPNWADATSDEQRLEKIITQKWIAMYPEGMNAWAEYRRTGYPKLFPVIQNDSQGVISTKLGVRRLTYTVDQNARNKANVDKAVTMLGGPDTGATHLFWDKVDANGDKNNF